MIGFLLVAAAGCTASSAPPVEEPVEEVEELEATEPAEPATAEPADTVAAPTDTAEPEPTATETAIPPTAEPSPTVEAVTPSLLVTDQAISNGTVTIDEAVSKDASWLVIHRDQDGSAGTAIGYAPLQHGVNEAITVQIDADQATPTLYAMLHIDDGVIGDYEFPYYDPPLEVDGEVIMQAFAVSGMAAATEGPPAAATSNVSIQDFQFTPFRLTVRVGDTVVWTQGGSATHTVSADDGSFDSGNLSNGEEFSFTFSEAGTFA
ncbi:MAG TPA: hypothetical protein VF434_01050, partial [Promineifilum sp.]